MAPYCLQDNVHDGKFGAFGDSLGFGSKVHIEPQMVNNVILLANTNKQSLVKESGPVFFHVLSVPLKKFAKQNILENKNINGICRFLHSPNEKP